MAPTRCTSARSPGGNSPATAELSPWGWTTNDSCGLRRIPTKHLILERAPALPQERAGGCSAATDLPPERLEAEIVTLVSRLSSATYDLLVLIGELDARGTWAFTGALSCAAWLAHYCDVELVTAHNQVRVARAMRQYSQLNSAMAGGDVSYAKARVLVPHLKPEHADDLVHLASATPAAGLGTAIARWSYGHETPEEIDSRHHAERSTSWRTDPDGMVTITARLAPANAAMLCAVIDRRVTTNRAPGRASLRQQRADALVATATEPSPAADDNVTTGVTAEVVIHVDESGNTLPDGTPLTDRAVTSLLPDAFVSLLMEDNQRQPIDASPPAAFPPVASAESSTPANTPANTPAAAPRHSCNTTTSSPTPNMAQP